MAHDEDLDNVIAWIETEICNDNISDEELIKYFLANGLDKETVIGIIRQRDRALSEVMWGLDITELNLVGIEEPKTN